MPQPRSPPFASRTTAAVRRRLMEIYTQTLLWNAHQRRARLPLQGSVPAITAACVGNALFNGLQNEGYQAVKGCRPSSFTSFFFSFPTVWEKPWQRSNAASPARLCRFALRNLKKKKQEKKKTVPQSIFFKFYFYSGPFFFFLLANVSRLVPQRGDVGRAPRILAQYFKPPRSLCFGSSKPAGQRGECCLH